MLLTYQLRIAAFGPNVWLGVLLPEEVKWTAVMDLETTSGQVCHNDKLIHVDLLYGKFYIHTPTRRV